MKELYFKFNQTLTEEVKIVIECDSRQKIAELLYSITPDKVFVICDSNVKKLYGNAILYYLSNVYDAVLLTHAPGEENKSLETVQTLAAAVFKHNITPASCVIALGGGVTGNIVGLLASVIYRGVTLVHVPTTLLAQLDSAPDVKQSVNTGSVKNAVGVYKAPALVIIDPMMLKSLHERELRSGIGEAFKHGISQDLKLVDYLCTANTQDIQVLELIIKKTIALKIKHWDQTPTIWNDRKKIERLTHLGHTTGKVLEMVRLEYLNHGEAISHGLVIESYASFLLGYLAYNDVEYIITTLHDLNLLFPLCNDYSEISIIKRLYPDKMSKPVFALLQKLGDPTTLSLNLPKELMEEALNWYFKKFPTV